MSFGLLGKMSRVTFAIVAPPVALKEAVECFRVATYAGNDAFAIKVCPSGLPGILFQHHDGRSAIENIVTDAGRVVYTPLLFVHGQITEQSIMHFHGPFTTIQVVLKPYALRMLFGIDATSLTNGSAVLSKLCPGNPVAPELEQTLAEAKADSDRIAHLAQFLEGLVAMNYPRDRLVKESVELIAQVIEDIKVKLVLKRLGVSQRQFERRFLREVGISPQLYIRIRRVNEAMRLMDTGKFERLSDAAYALNYFDRSHFIRDIRVFSGATPRSISQKVNDFHHDRVSSSYLYR